MDCQLRGDVRDSLIDTLCLQNPFRVAGLRQEQRYTNSEMLLMSPGCRGASSGCHRVNSSSDGDWLVVERQAQAQFPPAWRSDV